MMRIKLKAARKMREIWVAGLDASETVYAQVVEDGWRTCSTAEDDRNILIIVFTVHRPYTERCLELPTADLDRVRVVQRV